MTVLDISKTYITYLQNLSEQWIKCQLLEEMKGLLAFIYLCVCEGTSSHKDANKNNQHFMSEKGILGSMSGNLSCFIGKSINCTKALDVFNNLC